MYLFAEGGSRFYHANFRWGAQIGLFLLFAALSRWGLLADLKGWRRWLFWAAYLAHLAAGLWYYGVTLVSMSYD